MRKIAEKFFRNPSCNDASADVRKRTHIIEEKRREIVLDYHYDNNRITTSKIIFDVRGGIVKWDESYRVRQIITILCPLNS